MLGTTVQGLPSVSAWQLQSPSQEEGDFSCITEGSDAYLGVGLASFVHPHLPTSQKQVRALDSFLHAWLALHPLQCCL